MKNLPFLMMSTLIVCFVSVNTHAASFNCAKANTWIEKSICSNTELSQLDETMAQQYKAEVFSTADHEDINTYNVAVRDEQRSWLKFQRNTCKSEECLIREYKERIGEKDVSYSENPSRFNPPNKQAFDTFYENVDIIMYNATTKVWEDAGRVTNSISIHSVTHKPTTAVIDADLIFTNGHSCSISSEVASWSDNHWSINDYHERAELRLYPVSNGSKTQLLLRDMDNQYQKSHCGMRGYFDRKVLESR